MLIATVSLFRRLKPYRFFNPVSSMIMTRVTYLATKCSQIEHAIGWQTSALLTLDLGILKLNYQCQIEHLSSI